MLMMPLIGRAEKDDVGFWLSAEVEKKLSKKWTVGVEGELRLNDNVSRVDRMSIGADVSYKITKGLKASAGYDYLHTQKESGLSSTGKYFYNTYWYPRHRVHADITGQVKVGQLKLSLRERWVYTWRPSFDRNRMNVLEGDAGYGTISVNAKDGKAENVLRSRAMAEYGIGETGFTPYISAEAYNAWSLQKVRYSVGTEYEFDKHHAVKLYYVFQDRTHRSSNDEVIDTHVFGMSYGYKF